MDFNLSEEQQQLRDGVARFVREQHAFETRRKLLQTEQGFSQDNWQRYADLGWLSLGLPEDVGGLGLSFVDVTILMQELGRGLVQEPIVSTTVLGARIIDQSGNGSARADLLPQIADGSLKIAFAHAERSNRYSLSHVETTQATIHSEGYRISGSKLMAIDAPSADVLIVSARMPDNENLGLFLVERNAPGLSLDNYALIDGSRAADLNFDQVQLQKNALLLFGAKALEVMEDAIDRATLAQVAETLGAMEAAMQITAEYIKTRKQFGQPLGKFQSLQHRMAEMFVKSEDVRSMLYRGLAFLEATPDMRKSAISMAKVVAAEAGRFVGAQGIQLHGGMGITEECSIGHYFKRLKVLEKLNGDIEHHSARVAETTNSKARLGSA
ncbi:acyl-CoA dehydrogenase family protein [Pseudomonas sp. BF-R-19]|uniref:acyl-CoA dehydrogenase family protein n=1 Tax=Pseudomonas sp. BF-R-19 TaxID=2832397 RepID=UPI001CBC1356|nr:acyl-CoA dehydrogenase family protein [Pseudomonas sp. BF-R-19]